MKKRLFIPLLLSMHLFLSSSHQLTSRCTREKFTVSIIVPCNASHFFLLSAILEGYQHQTVLPDEIIIALSGTESLNIKELNKLEQGSWNFRLKIIRSKKSLSYDQNRDIAIEHATGDILMYNDADDVPHAQRVEIIKYLFENYELDHIMHGYAHNRNNMMKIDQKQICNNSALLTFDTYAQAAEWGQTSEYGIASGCPCFVNTAINPTKNITSNNAIYISLPLLLYRHRSINSPSRSI